MMQRNGAAPQPSYLIWTIGATTQRSYAFHIATSPAMASAHQSHAQDASAEWIDLHDWASPWTEIDADIWAAAVA